jgi:hypothetical protein
MPSSAHTTSRPDGRITRGKTAPNRLRRVDAFVQAYAPLLLSRRDGEYARAMVVDLGYGENPGTTLEWADRLRRTRPNLPVLGVEIDPERVECALPFADDQTHFRLGGFNLPLAPGESARMVRAFNVLRQYEEHEVHAAYDSILAGILPGGLLVDGTSDPTGRTWTASLIRRPEHHLDGVPWRQEALVLGTNFRGGLEPESFQTRLPKSFIHRMGGGDPVGVFIGDWLAACRDTRSCEVWGPRSWFVAAAGALSARGHDVVLRQRWLRHGWLVWRTHGLSSAQVA